MEFWYQIGELVSELTIEKCLLMMWMMMMMMMVWMIKKEEEEEVEADFLKGKGPPLKEEVK